MAYPIKLSSLIRSLWLCTVQLKTQNLVIRGMKTARRQPQAREAMSPDALRGEYSREARAGRQRRRPPLPKEDRR